MKESVFWLFLRDARIAEITDKPITHFIYSHAHTDHIGGANTVVEAFPSVRTRVGRCHIKGFEENLHLDIGGKRLELSYHHNVHQESLESIRPHHLQRRQRRGGAGT